MLAGIPAPNDTEDIVEWIDELSVRVAVKPLNPLLLPQRKVPLLSTVTVCPLVLSKAFIELSLIAKTPPEITLNVPLLFKIIFPLELTILILLFNPGEHQFVQPMDYVLEQFQQVIIVL